MKMRKELIFAAAALILAACSNDESMDNSPVELRLTSGIEVQTRANTQSTSIVSNEEVSVWVDDATTKAAEYSANQLVANGSNGFNKAATGVDMYFPQTGNGVDIYAVHGPSFTYGDAFPTTENAKTFTVTADQSVMGTSYTNSDLLYAAKQGVARTTNAVPLTFYHMLSKIELAVVVGDGAPQLADSKAITIGSVVTNGTFVPTKISETAMETQTTRADMVTTGSTTGTMTIGQTTSTDFTDGTVNYNEAIIVPQDMSGKVITFTLADGGKLTYTIPADTKFESGKKYIYHITMNLTGLEIESSIQPWESVGAAVTGNATMN